MTRSVPLLGLLLMTTVAFYATGLISVRSFEAVVAVAGAEEMRTVPNPHSDWIFRATGTRSRVDCHDMSGARRGAAPVLDNAAVRNLIAMGRGAHRGRFADRFRCHPGGKPRGRR